MLQMRRLIRVYIVCIKYRNIDCVGVQRHVNPCGSFCVVSQRKGEKRKNSRRDEREEQGRKRNRNESEETEEIITFPLYPYLLQG